MAPDSTIVDGALADSHGTWLLSFDTIYLWGGSWRTQVAVLSRHGDRALAGPCQ